MRANYELSKSSLEQKRENESLLRVNEGKQEQ